MKKRLGVLTDRDLDAMTLVGVAGYCSVAQLARACFPTLNRAERRVKVLSDRGLLAVHVTDSRSSRLVTLTQSGSTTLRDLRGIETERRSAIKLHVVEHHLGVVELRLWLAALADAGAAELLAFHSGRSPLAAELGCAAVGLVPDTVAEVRLHGELDGVLLIFAEIDCGTESVDELHRKAERYSRLTADVPDAALWLVGTNASATARLLRVAPSFRRLPWPVVVASTAALAVRPVVPVTRGAGGLLRIHAQEDAAPRASKRRQNRRLPSSITSSFDGSNDVPNDGEQGGVSEPRDRNWESGEPQSV